MKRILLDNHIKFVPKGHEYYDKKDREYLSVTKFISKVLKEPFDENISFYIAKGKLGWKASPADIELEAKKIKEEWKKENDKATKWGKFVHNNLEQYFKTGHIIPEMKILITKLIDFIKPYNEIAAESYLYSIFYRMAGQVDLIVKRQKSASSVIDVYDYKTNIKKGIQFNSIGNSIDKEKQYNRYFLDNFNHMEDCNYNLYCFQLNIYAIMLQLTYGFKIGRLGIIFIHKSLDDFTYYPVPFMKYDTLRLLEERKKSMLDDPNIKTNLIIEDDEF